MQEFDSDHGSSNFHFEGCFWMNKSFFLMMYVFLIKFPHNAYLIVISMTVIV